MVQSLPVTDRALSDRSRLIQSGDMVESSSFVRTSAHHVAVDHSHRPRALPGGADLVARPGRVFVPDADARPASTPTLLALTASVGVGSAFDGGLCRDREGGIGDSPSISGSDWRSGSAGAGPGDDVDVDVGQSDYVADQA